MHKYQVNTKIKASAIQYALILSIVFAFLLGGLILYAGSNRKILTRLKIQELLRLNANSGIEYSKVFLNGFKFNEVKRVSLFNSGLDSIEISKENWGAYQVVKSRAVHQDIFFEKLALMGGNSNMSQTSLYLADYGSALALCGETRIEGVCFLPKRGVKRAYIANQNYIGSKLIYGVSKRSSNQLPQINSELIDAVNRPVLTEKKNWVEQDTVLNSFKNEALYFVSEGSISINTIVIKGKVIIESKDSIFISNQANLDGVIVKAPTVHIQAGFEGTLQIYATHKIVLENDVTLKYPTVLGLMEDTKHNKISGIEIGTQSIVLGSVFLLTSVVDFRKELLLNCQTDSKIAGLVYCQGKTQLQGEVNGQIYTNKFYLKTASSAYENHLLGAKIINKLPKEFSVIPLLEKNKYLKTIKWLK